MKKTFSFTLKTITALIVFILSQARAWALDTTTATTIDKSQSFLAQPWIWIGIAVIAAIKLLGPFDETDGDYVIVRKKNVVKKNS